MTTMSRFKCSLLFLIIAATAVVHSCAQLTPDFYDHVCPDALPTIRRIVEQAIQQEPRMGASLLRLHFHDCFVNVSPITSSLARSYAKYCTCVCY